MSLNLAYMGPPGGRLLTKSETTMLPRELQLAGTASSSVGICWDPPVGFDDKRCSYRRDCNCGPTIGISLTPNRSAACSAAGAPPVLAGSPDCCGPVSVELEGSARSLVIVAKDVASSAGLAQRRCTLEWVTTRCGHFDQTHFLTAGRVLA